NPGDCLPQDTVKTGQSAAGRRGSGGFRDLDHELADVFAIEETVNGDGRVFETVDDGFAVLELAFGNPGGELHGALGESLHEVDDDETAHLDAAHEDGREVGAHRRVAGVV